MKLETLSLKRLEQLEMLDRGKAMLVSLASRKEIWNSESREKAGRWINWRQVEGYRYDEPEALSVSYDEKDSQCIMSFSASRFPGGRNAMFESRTSHVAQFLVSSSGELLKNGDTFDDCPAVFSTAEFIAIAPDSLSCWSDQKKYPSDSMIELAESSRVFAKEFLDHRREESRSRPELDEKDHLMKGRAFNLFRKQVSYLGEKPLTLAGTIGAHVYG